jgi:hypothetical protein
LFKYGDFRKKKSSNCGDFGPILAQKKNHCFDNARQGDRAVCSATVWSLARNRSSLVFRASVHSEEVAGSIPATTILPFN